MGARLVPTYVGKIEIESDEEAPVGTNTLPHSLIRRPGQSLLIHTINVIASLTKKVDVHTGEVLVKLDGKAHRSGRSSSS